jgi:hypothetical protein
MTFDVTAIAGAMFDASHTHSFPGDPGSVPAGLRLQKKWFIPNNQLISAGASLVTRVCSSHSDKSNSLYSEV